MRLMQGDCLKRMDSIDDASVDLVLVDLPYGTTDCAWDSVIPFEPLWAQYRRVMKPHGAAIFTASQPFTTAVVNSNRQWFRDEWIWRKNMPTRHLNAKRQPLKDHESVIVFAERAPRYFPQGLIEIVRKRRKERARSEVYRSASRDYVQTHTNYPRTVLEFDCARNGRHPSEKPVALFEYLIRTYSREGETVLDNTMGSGTTGEAAMNTGRDFIGIEKDPRYFKLASERIAEAKLRRSA